MPRKLLIFLAVSTLLMATCGTALSNLGLHMAEPPNGRGDGVPPDGTMWHEIYPQYCISFSQHRYFDNGDGVVSICDYIELVDPTGATYRHHITDVYWTYVFEVPGALNHYFEASTDAYTSPVGDYWHLVYPPEVFCHEWEIFTWIDATSNNILDACDQVIFGDYVGNDISAHLVEVSIDIVVDDGTPVNEGTWGKIKSFFGDVF